MNIENSLQKAAACVGVCCLSFSMAVIAQSSSPGAPAASGGAGVAGVAGAPAALSSADRAFVEEAAASGMAEVVLGRMADQKASNAQVRQFGARMVQDHGRANSELLSLAAARGMRLATSLPAHQQAEADRLGRLTGTDFDRAYLRHMLEEHQAAVSRFAQQAQAGSDAQLKAWAGRILPTLREHLQLARTAHSSVNPGQ